MSEGEITSLPEDDPHYAQPPSPRKTRRERQEDAGQMALIPADPWQVERNVCGWCSEPIHSVAGSGIWTHAGSGQELCAGSDTIAIPSNLREL
jgi:hypothetical protein